MLAKHHPSPGGRRLASELRRLREAAGVSGEVAARKLGWSASKVSRIENARTCVSPEDAGKLLGLYRVPDETVRSLTALAVRAWGERDLAENARFSVAEILAWAPSSVPLILRTPDYHAAVLGTLTQVTTLSPGMIRAEVDRNAIWQARLAGESPIVVRAVLDETALRRSFGGPAVMAAQAGYLAEMDGMENVDLRVLPLARGGPSHLPPFTCTRYADSVDDLPVTDEAEVATLAGPWRAESERDVWLHWLAFAQLAGAAEPAADHLKSALAGWS